MKVASSVSLALVLCAFPLSGAAVRAQAPPYAWGTSTNGLRIGIASAGSEGVSSATAAFTVAFENTSDSDFSLNLGWSVGNGKMLVPNMVRLVVTDLDGGARELRVLDPMVDGRIDDFIVPLRHGAVYDLPLSLKDMWDPVLHSTDISLAAGTQRIMAVFDGKGAQSVQLDMRGASLINFWKGTARSGALTFDAAAGGASK